MSTRPARVSAEAQPRDGYSSVRLSRGAVVVTAGSVGFTVTRTEAYGTNTVAPTLR